MDLFPNQPVKTESFIHKSFQESMGCLPRQPENFEKLYNWSSIKKGETQWEDKYSPASNRGWQWSATTRRCISRRPHSPHLLNSQGPAPALLQRRSTEQEGGRQQNVCLHPCAGPPKTKSAFFKLSEFCTGTETVTRNFLKDQLHLMRTENLVFYLIWTKMLVFRLNWIEL